jgi:hypothetical protein
MMSETERRALTPFEPRTQVRVIAPERFAGRTGAVSEASVVIEDFENLVVVEMDQVDADDLTGVKAFMSEELEELEETT